MSKPKSKSVNNALLSNFLNNLIIYRDLQAKFSLNYLKQQTIKNAYKIL